MDRERVIEVAVNWWADKISKRHHHDNGDNSNASIMACLMADISYKPVTQEQLEIFKNELRKQLENEYEKIEKGYCRDILLMCDYNPCFMLAIPANNAGISNMNFPFKSSMVIEDGTIKISDGYCKPFVEIGE